MLAQRISYWQLIQQVQVKDLVFLDEAGVNLAMTRLYARALRGQRATATKPNKRGQNTTMVAAIASSGVVTALTYLGGTDGLTFKTFIDKCLVPHLWKGACVVMDNFSSHKVEGIQAAIEAVGAKLIYLPPYRPTSRRLRTFGQKSDNTFVQQRCAQVKPLTK